ncbi:MAG: NAD-dependent epimerase/dehydratase family protein [Bradyrhizobium sp.]|uniref:NAD-dependent epimerase/dehydratase family protein n=1 Tax=Bradyrhizobium sp. TaxID=376 RepID=UPI0011FC15BF|nr:NAD-dependent epimerase/dehydratase family protein [Bradyrhizobium sp.]THD49792.1 MAG: NAD-dependent epimerase/dehydratase family protein [Bradyrhizobium sp.]
MSFRILVTGSSGFIGSAVSVALAAAGHSVRAASRRPYGRADHDHLEWVRLPNLEDEVDWDPLVAGMDIVVHLAAIAHRSHADGLDYTKANRTATARLVQACRRQGIKRLIFMSSIGAQAGSAADHVVTETDEPQPITAYDRAKLAAEEEIRLSGVPFTILRPVIVYGPGAKANIALIVRIAGLPLPLPFGAFKNRRSLLSIDNLIEAIILCLDGPATLNQTFIVCDREPITLAEMFVTLREAAGHSPRLVSIPPTAVKAMIVAAGRQPLWDRIGRELVASAEKLQKAGWSPKVETKAGLRAMMAPSISGTAGAAAGNSASLAGPDEVRR